MIAPGQIRAFSLTWLSYAGLYLCRRNFSVLMPLLIVQAGYTNDSLADAVFAYSIAYSAGQFANGTMADRFGARTVVTIGMMLSAFASALMGFSQGVTALLLLQMVNGFAQSAGWPGLLKIMGQWFPRETRGTVMGWWSTNYVLGGFIATNLATYAAVTAPFFSDWGWRRGAIFPSFILLPLAILFAVLVRERTIKPGGDSARQQGFGMLRVARLPRIQVLAATYFILKMTRYSFLYWLPMYMTQRLLYGPGEAGYTSSVFELAGFAGAVGAGYVSDRYFGARRFPVAVAMLVGLGLACLLHPVISGWSRWANVLGVVLIGIMTYGPDTLLGGAAVQDAAPPGEEATAAGFVNGVGSTGQLLSPYIVVYAVKYFGWDRLFFFFAGLAVCGAVVLTVSRAERRGVVPA